MPSIRVNDTELYYVTRGESSAPAVLLSHSLFFDHRMFEQQIEALSDEYHVIAYDQRGHGRSPHPQNADYHMDTLTADAAGLIEALDLAPVHFVGNSMGGFIAMRLAARKPSLLRSIAVLGSSAEEEHKIEEFRPLVEALKTDGTGPVLDTLMFIMFGDATLASPEQASLCQQWRQRMGDLPSTVGYAAQAVIEREAVLDELRGCPVPMLVIAGEEDHAYSAQLSQNIVEVVANGDYQLARAAGHSVAVEAPAVVNQYLRAHFHKSDDTTAQSAA